MQRWIIMRKLSKKQHEIIFILSQSAGFSVWDYSLNYMYYDEFPKLLYDGKMVINHKYGVGENLWNYKIMTYTEVITELKSIIKKQLRSKLIQ